MRMMFVKGRQEMAIIAIFDDFTRHLLFIAPTDFDVQAWYNEKKQYFAVVGIKQIQPIILNLT
jgi:hypothetical protein